MFKISTIDTRCKRRLVVEGRLTTPWVNELLASWKDASLNLEDRKLVIDVSSLTVISREGEDAIFSLLKDGAKFSDFGIMKWPTSAVCFGPPLDTANFYSGSKRELGSGGGSWTGEPRWSCLSRFGWSMSSG